MEGETTATSESQGFLGTLGINGGLFIAQLVNFAIVAFVLWRFVFRPLMKTMAQRAVMIKKGLDDAGAAATAHTAAEAEGKQIVAEARTKAATLMTEVEREAEAARQKTREKTKRDVEALILEGKVAIAAEREKMVKEARQELAGIVVAATEKILKKRIDPATDAEVLRELGGN